MDHGTDNFCLNNITCVKNHFIILKMNNEIYEDEDFVEFINLFEKN